VIGPINPATLVGEAECPRDFDFYTMTQDDLQKFDVEVEWTIAKVGLIHGVRSMYCMALWLFNIDLLDVSSDRFLV
jgi:hypothetical protein